MPGRKDRQRTLRRRRDPEERRPQVIQPLTADQIAAGADVNLVVSQLNPPTEEYAKKSGDADNLSLPGKPTDYDLLREQILRLWHSGLPIPAIARRLGTNPTLCQTTISNDQQSKIGKEGNEAKATALAAIRLTTTTYTAIQQELLRRFTMIQATRDRVLGAGLVDAAEVTTGTVRALNDQIDSSIREFGRATKEYVDVMMRMGVGAGPEREKDGSYTNNSGASFYASMPVSDRDLADIEKMSLQQLKFIRAMKKKSEKVGEVEVVSSEISEKREDLEEGSS